MTAPDLDDLRVRSELMRAEIKAAERHVRMAKQLAAQLDDDIQTYSQEAQGERNRDRQGQ